MQNNIQKNIKSRVILKHDIEENWNRAEDSFRPLNGEIIIYDPDAYHPYIRYKRGKTDPKNTNQTLLLKELEFETNMHIGPNEPQNPPVGLLWLDTSDEVKLIKFYTLSEAGEIKEYTAEENMTLREWVNSEYNTEGWYCLVENGIHGPQNPEDPDHYNGIGLDTGNSTIQFATAFSPSGADVIDCDDPIIPNHQYILCVF